jgi:VRR-NUC domain
MGDNKALMAINDMTRRIDILKIIDVAAARSSDLSCPRSERPHRGCRSMRVFELTIHIAAVHALRQRIADGWMFWHTPNGEQRDARQTAKFHAMGVRAGIPDLTMFSPEGNAHFMEFKSENGSLDEAQRKFQLWAIRAKILHSVVRSVDEAMKVFRFWGCVRDLELVAK